MVHHLSEENKIKRLTVLALSTFEVNEIELAMFCNKTFGIPSITKALHYLEADGLIVRNDVKVKITSDGRQVLAQATAGHEWLQRLVLYRYLANLGGTNLVTFGQRVTDLINLLDSDNSKQGNIVSAQSSRVKVENV